MLNMEDKNDLSTQRRNLMIMNVLIFLLSITNKKIESFVLLNINFKINESINFINSFNDLLVIVWIYFLVRYSSSLFYISRDNKSLYEDKTDTYLSNKNFTLKFLNNTFIKLARIIFKKESLNEFPIILSLWIIIYFYSNKYLYFGLFIVIILLFIYSHNIKKISNELKKKKKEIEEETKRTRNLKNKKILSLRKKYCEKKKFLKNRKRINN